MYAYKLIITYDGTAYSGWQIQPNALSIQEIILKALKKILQNQEITLIGAGRTDAGVHALGQVAHFHYPQPIDIHRVLFSLNSLLPKDIRVLSMESVSLEFHAQRSAVSKEYHYFIHLDKIMDPFRRFYSWHIPSAFSIPLLKEAASCFIGTHDFTSFTNQSSEGAAARNPVRTLFRIDTFLIDGGIRLEFEGNGFLYKMVRNIVGTLVAVAMERQKVEAIIPIMAAKDRRLADKAAPPQGLFLISVKY